VPSLPSSARGAAITGWGRALPDKVVTNADLEATMDTSDQWIRERTGIAERRIGGTTASLSIESGRRALACAGVDPESIDALILSTTTPDRTVPATSATVQHGLGLRCGAFDVNAACSGFVYGLAVANGLIAIGANRVLLIGTDTLSRIVDWTDRNTAILFADGSGAAVVEAVEGRGALLGWDIDADGSAEDLLYCEVGGPDHGRLRGEVARRVRHLRGRHCNGRAAPGEHPHHLGGVRTARNPDVEDGARARRNGQHVVGIHSARMVRGGRRRPAQPR
jgi:3-oxoacyl-[acyl-carrier-protein] synthase-3